jgi:hypothetical protein
MFESEAGDQFYEGVVRKARMWKSVYSRMGVKRVKVEITDR